MKYRKLGKIDWMVSALGFGCMRLPSKKNPFDLRTDYAESIRLIRRSIDLGVNYFDTGWPYHLGASEKILGQALLDGYREKVFLVTKLPMFMVRKAEDFDRFLERQLEKLQTGYLDAYLFHGLNENNFKKVIDFNLIEKMEKAREKGLIKYIGFSFHDTLPVFKNIIDYYNWDLTQIQYNYLDTAVQATTEGLEYAYKKGIGVVVMEPLKGGVLASPPGEALDILKSSTLSRTPVEWALQFLWNKKEVAVVLSGMGSMKMVEENCRYADNSGIDSLGQAEVELLDSIVEIYRKQILVPCTACNYCMPCPSGVNIPQNFAYINLSNSRPVSFFDKMNRWSVKGKYKRLASDRKKINKDRPNGNASLCTNCGQCVPKCPQTINIPVELGKVHAVLGEKQKIETVFG